MNCPTSAQITRAPETVDTRRSLPRPLSPYGTLSVYFGRLRRSNALLVYIGTIALSGSGHAGPRRADFPPRRRRYCVLFSIGLATKGTLVFAKACVSEPAGSSRYSRGNSWQVHMGEAARVLEGEHIGGWRQNMTLPASIVEPIAVFVADAPDDCRRCRLGPRPEIDDDPEVEGRVDTVAKVQHHLTSAQTHRTLRAAAMSAWCEALAAA
jgi:hypothetical protein